MLTIALISIDFLTLSGCSSDLNQGASDNPTVADAYLAAMQNGTAYNVETRRAVSKDTLKNNRLPAVSKTALASESITNTLNTQFPTLPNPQSKMYIFGHFTGNEQIPVSGHFVPFSLYTRTYYALPNEVLKPYNDGQFTG